MKNFTLLFLILSVCSVSAQTFTTVNNANHVFFLTDNFNSGLYPDTNNQEPAFQPYQDSTLLGYRIDSVYFDTMSSEQVFLFNRMKRYVLYSLAVVECDSTSWIGAAMRTRPDGMEVYQNALGENIYYNTMAMPGESWLMFDGLWGSCTATMDSHVILDTILGQPDSIYSIICELNVQSQLRTDTILVAAKAGFVKMLDHFLFPTDTISKYLCGSSYPQKGLTQPDEFNYHNYSVGDKIHTDDYWRMSFDDPGQSARRIFTITHKEENDTCVTYHREIEWCSCVDCPDPEFNRTYDTVKYVKNYLKYLPLEQANLVYMDGGILYETTPIGFYDGVSPECWGCPTNDLGVPNDCIGRDSDNPGGNMIWKNGLGLMHKYAQEGEPNGGGDRSFNVLYYSINGHEFGFPFDFSNCYIGTNNNNSLNNLELVPNPSQGSFYIDGIDAYEKEFVLHVSNLQGQLVHKENAFRGEAIVEVDLPTGLYFIHLYSDQNDAVFTARLMIVD